MNAVSDAAVPGALRRDPATWYAYLLLAYYTYVTSIQGNIIPYLKADLGLTYTEVSLHPSAVAVGFIAAGFFGERLVLRIGRSALLATAAYGSAAGLLLLSLAPAAWASIGACLVIGIFGAFIPAIVPAILSDIHGARRDIAYAEANALCYAFSIMGPLITALAAALNINWRLGLFVGALAAVVIVRSGRGASMPAVRPAVAAASTPLPPAYWAYWAMLSLAVAIEFSAILWAPAYLAQVAGLSASASAAGAAVFFAAMLLGRIVGTRLVQLFPTGGLFLAACGVTVVGFCGYWFASLPLLCIAGLFVIGLGVANFFPLIIGFCMRAAGPASERGSARAIIAPGVAILLNPPLLGTIADHAGLHAAQLMIPVFTALALVAFGVARTLERRAA